MPIIVDDKGNALNDQQAGQWLQQALSRTLGVEVSVVLRRHPDPFDSEMEQTHIRVLLANGQEPNLEQSRRMLAIFRGIGFRNITLADQDPGSAQGQRAALARGLR